MHYCGMRTHSQIIAALKDDHVAAERGVSIHTVRSWRQRNSIPAEHWNGFARAGWATLEELAAGAEKVSLPETQAAA